MDGALLEGECGSEVRVLGLGLALELHSHLDEVKGVGGAPCNDGGNASFDETFDTHLELCENVSSFERINGIEKVGVGLILSENFPGKLLRERWELLELV